MIKNFYKYGGGLNPHTPSYVKRFADDQLYELLKQNYFCYVFNCRQMGKSSLQAQVKMRLEATNAQGNQCVYLTLQEMDCSQSISENQWYREFSKKIFRNLNLQKQTDFNECWSRFSGQGAISSFSDFMAEILLPSTSSNLVIFIDEIDRILELSFRDNFFGLIRTFHEKRAEYDDFNRLTFCFLGVATPNDLIQNPLQSPFNIGRAIELRGFEFNESLVLAQGLQDVASVPEEVLREILFWTGGQPFLTQKVCALLVESQIRIGEGQEKSFIEEFIYSSIIRNWEGQDEPIHLRSIKNRLLAKEVLTGKLLEIYRHILQNGYFTTEGNQLESELRLSGLVVKRNADLEIFNPIYREVFSLEWVQKQLDSLRPYAIALNAWLASEKNNTYLLDETETARADIWREGKFLTREDEEFIRDSKLAQKDKDSAQKIEAEREAKKILEKAKKKAQKALIGSIIASALIIAGTLIFATVQTNKAEKARQAAIGVTRLEQRGIGLARRFEREGEGQIKLLLEAIDGGQELQAIVKTRAIDKYSSPGLLFALRTILDGIREQNHLDGHRFSVGSVAFSPDGQYLATGSSDGTTRLWDRQGNSLVEFKGPGQDVVVSVVFSPDSKYLATGAMDSTARLWDLQGNLLAEFKGQSVVWSIAFSPDGKYLATGSRDTEARLWDLRGNMLVEFKGHGEDVTSVAFSPDGKYLATGSRDHTARLWDLRGNMLVEFKGYREAITSVAFSPDSKYLATGSWGKIARLWDLRGNSLVEFKGHRDGIDSVAFSPDGKYLATGSSDRSARLWNLQGNLIGEFKGHRDVINSVAFSPDGKYLATGSSDRSARLWNLQGNLIGKFKKHRDSVQSVAFTADSKYLVTGVGGWDDTARFEDLQGNSLVEFKHPRHVTSVALSADGKYLATGSWDWIARLWDLQGNLLVEFKAHEGNLTSIALSSDSQYLATGSTEGNARLWDLQGNLLVEFKGHRETVTSVAFSPNGKYLATGSGDSTFRIWDLRGNLLVEFKNHQGSRSRISVAFSPDGKYLATGSTDNTARLWDLQGNLLVEFKGHQENVDSVAFSPDGKYLATGSNDNTARLWDLQGNILAEFKGHREDVKSVAFSPDGKYLATGSNDKTVRLWPIEDLDALLVRGCHWLKDYFVSHPRDLQELPVCQQALKTSR
ncbi:AAA-like domain-containing protein [Dolichospermum sp. LEGE 00240]|uniref:AAA-like domain-containing protein n=1 Tax=Dolichospermum sp. LEGE 00240 TaxID=1828603 RepID=UPI00188230D2|nr:AAA-like domain-containing protein [Dolichospermum sp. LEGE 00240]MBE9251495.1 AAA-like domain-containing protein [Dolichospermum sp. LEGE 00240]